MADGYARTTGRPGVLSAAAGLATADACNSPVLCITGHIRSEGIGRGFGALHAIKDQAAVLDAVTEWPGLVRTPEEAPGLVRRA